MKYYSVNQTIRLRTDKGPNVAARIRVVEENSCKNCVFVKHEHGAMGQLVYGCKEGTGSSNCRPEQREDGKRVIYKFLQYIKV